TVQDVTAPVVDCNSFTVELNDDGTVSITSDDIDNGSYDNCSPVTISISQEDFDCSDIGGDLDELIISEYIDGTGNNKWIEIYNGTGNEVILANGFNSIYSLNIYSDGSSTPTTIGLLGSIPADGVYKIAHTAAIGSNINLGSPNVFFDGNDAIALMNNGNAVDIIGVIGQDPGAAGWSSGGISTNNTTLVRDKNVLVGNTSNFLGGLGTEWIQSSQDTFTNLGVHYIEITGFSNNVILTVTDVSGNTATCEAEITIVDVTKPDVECNDITVELDASGNYSLTQSDFNAIGLGSTDACGIASMTASPSSFTCANVGANTVTLTVTDVNGNFDTCVATVTVQDNIVPVVVTQDITVQLNASGNVSITPAQIDNGSNDACSIDTLSVSPNSFTCAEVGDNTVTLTVTDVNGNVSTDTAIVTVEDNVAPQAICQAFTIGLDGDGVAVITGADVDGGSNDACGIASLSVFPNTFGCGDIGDNTVTLTVTDNNGNVSTCTTTVTVTGIIPTVSISESPLPDFCQGAVVVLTADSTEAAEYLWSTGETTESIEVPGNGTYSVTVTSLTNCTAYAEYEVTGFDAGALISAYTIIASEKVDLKNSVVVQSGGVGVTDSDGEIKLDKASHIIEFAQADEIEIKAGSSVGTAIYQPANPIIPTFIYNTYSNNSSPDAKANDNQTLTLNGGVYDKVEIEEDATIIFTAPNVYINELKTKKRATIEFTGCTNMFINKDFELDEDGTFNSSGKMVTLYIDDKLEVKKGSNFTGRVYANDEDIKVKGGNNSDVTTMTGIFIGKKVEADKNVIWNADYNCDTCPVEAPENNGGEEPTEDYVIIGFNEVHLHGDIAVQTGGVGVTKHNKKIKVHDDSDINEFAKASKIQVNGGSTVGTKIYQQADPIIPLFVINTYSNNGSPDVTVNNGQTVTLNGDNYDKIDLKDGATVIFTETNVYIKELKTDKDVSIEFTGCTNLIIKKKFKLDDRGTINSDGHKVTIYVDDKVEIDKGSWVDANIYAYNDEIDIDGSNNDATFMTGLFIGKKVHAHENVIFNQGQTGAPCAVAPPSDIYTEANDEGVDLEGITMEVTSWPNPSDNEFNVKVTSKNTTDVITINVFDMSNKLVHSDEFRPDEVHKFGNRLEGGVYIVKVSQGDKVRTVRLVKY
ncbi:MAG: lamin tail domain-containing protein, partial [Flavobacteriaceae bacterium]|nr:lamin tail domain-containing protein [Flavobacteriaceae bacterium]